MRIRRIRNRNTAPTSAIPRSRQAYIASFDREMPRVMSSMAYFSTHGDNSWMDVVVTTHARPVTYCRR